MKLSQNAKLYQLEHGHTMTAVVTRGKQTGKFRYGLVSDKQTKTTYAHGIDGAERTTEVETVDFVNIQFGDKVELENGAKGKVHEVTQTLLDKSAVSLRFIPFKNAEKITKITIKYV